MAVSTLSLEDSAIFSLKGLLKPYSSFDAFWTGNTRSREKKVGIFTYPKVKGSFVQDMDVNGVSYPLTLFFEGTDNDIEAQKFF